MSSKTLISLLMVSTPALMTPFPWDLECQYLRSHKELVCQCTRYHSDIVSLPRLISRALGHDNNNTMGDDNNVTGARDRVESLKIEHCASLHVSLDLREITQPFYQLRIENMDSVMVRDIQLNHDGDLDLVIRNVRSQVTLSGCVTCEDCGHSVTAERDSEDIRDMARPTLVIQLKNVTQTQVIYLEVTGVDTRLSARNVDRLAIDNTVIDKLASNSVEVWYAESFSVENTAVKEAASESITLNHVTSVLMSHTLGLTNSSLRLLSPASTRLVTRCLEAGEAQCQEDPGPRRLQWSSSSKTGTLVLITLCGLGVIIVIITLCVLNKRGKLNNML